MNLLHRGINIALTCLWNLGWKKSTADDLATLARMLLRRYPFWARGHIILAEESLKRDAIASAYASAQCLQYLSKDDSTISGHYHFILGRCFLRRGDWRAAHQHLSEAINLLPGNHHVTEEQCAALILGGEYRTALERLLTIPDRSLSAEAKAAIAFARSKVGGAD